MEKHILTRKNVLAMMLRYMKENPEFWRFIFDFDIGQAEIQKHKGYRLLYYFLDAAVHQRNIEKYHYVERELIKFNMMLIKPAYYKDIIFSPLMDRGSEYYARFKNILGQLTNKCHEYKLREHYINSDELSVCFADVLSHKMTYDELDALDNKISILRKMERDYFNKILENEDYRPQEKTYIISHDDCEVT